MAGNRGMARIGNGRFPVRSKLVAVLLLPVLLLVALGASQVIGVRRDAREARAEARLAASVTGPGSFLKLVIDERNHTAVYLLGAEELFSSVGPGRYLQTRDQVDEARREFVDFVGSEGGRVEEIYAPALAAIGRLDTLRAEIDAYAGPRGFQNVEAVQTLFERIGEVTAPLFNANRRVSQVVTDPVLQQGAALVDQALRQSDTIALLTYNLVVAAMAGEGDGINTGDEFVNIAGLLRDLRVGEQAIRLNGEGDYGDLVDALFASEHIGAFGTLVESALDTGVPEVSSLFASAGNEEDFGYDDLRDQAEARIEVAVDDINADARQAQLTFMVAGLVILAVLAVVTALVARSITRPLRSLTYQAIAMADRRLPGAVQSILDAPPSEDVVVPTLEPIDVRTRDEVADVAKALTTVQESALNLAVEQAALRRNIADSFVHLGRRNQSLLGRQLDFITELERGETHPTTLANLFRLDHLATRMRRNAESLLVLAGIEPPRVWQVPVQVSDVVRAALGEIENYQRVEIMGIEPAAIVGSAAADVAHLLAELIENALAFSPPHQSVAVNGRYRSAGPYVPSSPLAGATAARAANGGSSPDDADEGGFTIIIADSGIGMSEEDIARANRRLAGQESYAVAPSQYLGHYVAGMIALRHGITVRLAGAGHRGTTATVTLPAGLLSSQGASSITPADRAASPPLRGPGTQEATATRGLHPGGRAGRYDDAADTYRVGETEFHIDIGTLDPLALPVATSTGPPGPGAPGAPVVTPAGQPAPPVGPDGPAPSPAPTFARRAPSPAPPFGGQAPTPGGRSASPAPGVGHVPGAARRAEGNEPPRLESRAPQSPPTAADFGRPAPSGHTLPGVGFPGGGPARAPGTNTGGNDVVGEAQRARYVRDTLSRFSAGLAQGRGASAREQGEQDADVEGSQGGEPPA